MGEFANGIGGYGELELPNYNQPLHERAYSFQSARAALFCLLKNKPIKKILLPDYICDSLNPIFARLKVSVGSYPVDDALNAYGDIALGENEVILIVNYFGICRTNINKFLNESKISRNNIIIDNSQALFESEQDCFASIYSPRKFLGIPDGGFLYTDGALATPNKEFSAINYVAHLIERSIGDVQKGYAKFLEAESALSRFEPEKMSKISKRIIQSYDLKMIREKRIRNYVRLHSEFRDINLNKIERSDNEVPLCFPLKVDMCVKKICKELVKSNVFLPRYWPNLDAGKHAVKWYKNTLFLPVDHRLNEEKINFLVEKVRELL